MATLILTAAGTAIGGPVGGALGAILGQAVDQRLFAPKQRRGPRLGDLAVQTSHYGSDIPKVFGTMRVAGTVIWATDLVEHRSSSGSGKGRPRTTNFSYTVSFAVALSGRRAARVKRIWADGKLLRGAAGDLKASTMLRFYDGSEDQGPDPLIASAEGPGSAPAYRGIAYVVFEDLDLTDFGNRIPSLTFEVDADDGPVTCGGIARELSEGLIIDGGTPSLSGYAAAGENVRSAISALSEPLLLVIAPDGERLRIGAGAAPPVFLRAEESTRPVEIARSGAAGVPAAVTFSYYDPARDYQIGTQRACREPASKTEINSLPAVLGAADAKTLAERRLAALWAGRTSATLRLPWRYADVRPGTIVSVDGEPGSWLVRRSLLEADGVALELSKHAPTAVGSGTASAGRAARAEDQVQGPTLLKLLDIPLGTSPAELRLFAAAAGTSSGWRSAPLLFSADGGASWKEIGRTGPPAVLGRSLNVLPERSSAVFDLDNVLEVELSNPTDNLESCSDSAIAAGANLAAVGSELLQFGIAERVGSDRYRLRRLLRGRRGTEWAASLHTEQDPFTLLSAETLLPVPVEISALGATAVAVAAGIGDPPEGTRAELPISGEALRPPAPVHVQASLDADGTLVITWVRRSRAGWEWVSGRETPLGEEREAYSVTLRSGDASRSFACAEPRLACTAELRAAEGLSFPLVISVVQLGTYAASRPAELHFG